MKRYRNIIMNIFLFIISLLITQHVQADALKFEGNTIQVDGVITATQLTDSHLYIAGEFTTITTPNEELIPRKNIVEIERSNLEITDWNPQPDAPIHDLVMYNDQLIIVGQFQTFNNQPHNYIVFINADTKEEISVKILLNQPVYALALDADVLYFGGDFQIVNIQERTYLASFDLLSNSLTLWNPKISGSIYDLLIYNNVLYVGGSFSSVQNFSRNNLAAFNIQDGELINWHPVINLVVTHIDYQNDQIIVTGFTKLNNQIIAKQIYIDPVTAAIISQEEVPLDPQSEIVSQQIPIPQISNVSGDELIVNESELGFQIPSLGEILTFAIRGFFVIAGLSALFFLLLGAFAWVTSGGDQDSIDAARNKIQAAVVGLLIMVAVLSLVWTLEQIIFNQRLCLGLSCPLTIPTLLEPSP